MNLRLAWFLVGLGMSGAAQAGAIVHVGSDVPALVYIDDEEVGETPITLKDIKAGKHFIRVENKATGEVKTYRVVSPRSAIVERQFRAEFHRAAEAPAPGTTSAPAPATEAAPLAPHLAPGETEPSAARDLPAGADQASAPPADDKAVEKKAKTQLRNRTRNVVLGLGIANEVFNRKDKSKKTLRKAAVAVGIANEALNR